MKLAHQTTIAISLAITVLVVQVAISLMSQIDPKWAGIATTLVSIGSFSIFVEAIAAGFSRFDWLLKFVLGKYYLRGTWGGRISTSGGRKLIFVEKYEQTTASLVIRGWSYELDRLTPDAWWVTKCVHIDPEQGQIVCLYETHIPKQNGEDVRYGTGRFHFTERASPLGPPTCMKGIAVDEFNPKGIVYEEVRKLSPKLLSPDEAVQRVLKKLMPAAAPDLPPQSPSGA